MISKLQLIKNFIIKNGELNSFKTGQLIIPPGKDVNTIFLLKEGQARLILKENNKRTTLKKFSKGEFIGLYNLVSGKKNCEFRASSQLITYSLNKEKFINFISKENNLNEFLKNYLFDEEIGSVIQGILKKSSGKESNLKSIFENLRNYCTIQNKKINIIKSLKNNDFIFYYKTFSEETEIKSLKSIQSFSNLEGLLSQNNIRILSFKKEKFIEYKDNFKTDISDDVIIEDDSGVDNISNNQIKLLNSNFSKNKDDFIQENLDLLKLLADLLNIPFRRDSILRGLKDSYAKNENPGIEMIGKLAASLGLYAVGAKISPKDINRLQTPALIKFKNNFYLIKESDEQSIMISNENNSFIRLDNVQIQEIFDEDLEVVLIEKSNLTKTKRFGLGWFLPVLRKYKKVLIQVLIASFVIQLFTLASPLIIQLIIDKVINQRSLDTLQVLGVALVIVTLLESVLGSLKTFLFTDATNRIDQRLGAEVIDHLLRLPLNYFDKRPVGELSSRISELEKIRNFLTGQALSTILDAFFSVIYIVIMFFYSAILTLVALAVIPIQIALTLIGAPLFRRQYRRTAEENAKTQSHLVEILSGLQTVKAQNAEIVSRWKWQDLYSKYISRTFEQTITGTIVVQFSQVLQKISQLLVLWVGAKLVLDGYLSLGQLIAFRIISGYVTQPVLRLSSIWQNIQELKISFERLADVIDTPQESDETDKDKIPLTEIQGEVNFQGISFSFNKSGKNILNNLDLKVECGQFVGIVGESGSGKSTLMKLLPRLYKPDRGKILIDNTDIDKVELNSLRRQIGIVPQEPLLFSGSISHNIALTNPDASSEEIIKAAKIADAHNFIMELPDGYSTNIGERATTLSGGQRQRISIARTLLGYPNLLIMDEATSALDYKTEKNVCDNLASSLKNQTVFFITHRLATIRKADLIVFMKNGSVAEVGTHDYLMNKKGLYFDLYCQQEN
ncbi:MAG: ATP-binding cassette domain-containing protein [Prochlorococcus marinus CUG1438]|nr:ATP-binding cassette domain-containing protein [Prochlorococcus marinus CUG1438]